MLYLSLLPIHKPSETIFLLEFGYPKTKAIFNHLPVRFYSSDPNPFNFRIPIEMRLEIDSVFKTFDDKTILNGAYLSLNDNELLGLFGRNGSGKSTLLKIIFGSISGDFSSKRVDGIQYTNGL